MDRVQIIVEIKGSYLGSVCGKLYLQPTSHTLPGFHLKMLCYLSEFFLEAHEEREATFLDCAAPHFRKSRARGLQAQIHRLAVLVTNLRRSPCHSSKSRRVCSILAPPSLISDQYYSRNVVVFIIFINQCSHRLCNRHYSNYCADTSWPHSHGCCSSCYGRC